MQIDRSILAMFVAASAAVFGSVACGHAGLPVSAIPEGKDTPPTETETPAITRTPSTVEAPLTLRASLSGRMLYVQRGHTTLQTFSVAVGTDRYPTPLGNFRIRKMIWNPSWRPPPDSEWAKGKTAKGPGDPSNPMKVVKIFFKEPDYYIHGTADVESLGSAASHGCLRMDPKEVAAIARLMMEHGGQPREENWFWRIIHFRREEKVIYLNNPISFTVDS